MKLCFRRWAARSAAVHASKTGRLHARHDAVPAAHQRDGLLVGPALADQDLDLPLVDQHGATGNGGRGQPRSAASSRSRAR